MLLFMTTEQLIINRMQHLPDYMHSQVIDYVDFLILKHENTELPEEHLKILMDRHRKYQKNPQPGEPWEVVRERYKKQYEIPDFD